MGLYDKLKNKSLWVGAIGVVVVGTAGFFVIYANTQTNCYNNARANYETDKTALETQYASPDQSAVDSPRYGFRLIPYMCAYEYGYNVASTNYTETDYVIKDGNSNNTIGTYSASLAQNNYYFVSIVTNDALPCFNSNRNQKSDCNLGRFDVFETKVFGTAYP